MFFVYYKHMQTGREEYINTFDTAKAAIEKIAANYRIDKDISQLGEYYYFLKQR